MEDLKFDFNDIVLVPAESSKISSRSECEVTDEFEYRDREFLPLMAAPMDTVVCEKNYRNYINADIIPCLPRGMADKHLVGNLFYFQSFGLTEVEKSIELYKNNKYELAFSDNDAFYNFPNILIDIANGHMSKLVDLVKEIKFHWPDIILMVGNVANPETFAKLGLAGADYVRCSIGTGAGCTTAANVSINYPMGSLITECKRQKQKYGELYHTKIVADGGMRNYSDIIKALALGADFVMIGSLFNKSMESSGFNYCYGIRLNHRISEALWRWGFPIKKKYRGMSTKAVQRSWGKSTLVTAEGITKYQKVEYSLSQWVENFKDYLRSAMSYCDAKNLDDFRGYAQYVFITPSARKRFDK